MRKNPPTQAYPPNVGDIIHWGGVTWKVTSRSLDHATWRIYYCVVSSNERDVTLVYYPVKREFHKVTDKGEEDEKGLKVA